MTVSKITKNNFLITKFCLKYYYLCAKNANLTFATYIKQLNGYQDTNHIFIFIKR